MSTERRRNIKTSQREMRALYVTITGTAGAPAAEGFDRFNISEVIDNSAGNYTVVFRKPFERECMVTGLVMHTADTRAEVVALAFDRVTIQTTDLAGTAADADFSLAVTGSDSRFDYDS